MSAERTSTTQKLMDSIRAGELHATAGWQLTLRDDARDWPEEVRDLVSLGGDVVAAGGRWIIVTEDLRDDILLSTEDAISEPDAVTIVMLDDLPDDMVYDPEAMDELHAVGWLTATGDAFVIPALLETSP